MPKSSKKKGTLMDSLKIHQAKAELAIKKKAQEAAYAPNHQQGSVRKRKRTAIQAPEGSVSEQLKPTPSSSSLKKGKGKVTIPFYSSRRILLVGEGNFSFALSLITTDLIPVTPQLLFATSYDSEAECYSKYPDAQAIVDRLRAAGATVHFDVDATKLHKHKELRKLVYDTVAFNFPHVGAGIKDQDRNIVVNQRLIAEFLQSIAPLLAKGKDPSSVPGSRKKRKRENEDEEDDNDEDRLADIVSLPSEDEYEDAGASESDPTRIAPLTRGSVLITLRDAPPYTLWDIPRLAKDPPPSQKHNAPPLHRYKLVRSFQFHPEVYKGYEHRRTIGGSTGLKANEDLQKGQGVCRTWDFVVRDETQEDE